jgi:hypothetical protein
MKAQEKAKEIAKKYEQYGCECTPHDCEESALEMYQWAQDEFMQKAENAYCNQCIKNPCRIKIEHGSLCYNCELFLKHILKEL